MSGELTLSNFRYTTTNNNDFVIGDPTASDVATTSKYLVFQTSTIPGYLNNPYIGIVPAGGGLWNLVLSNNGSTISTLLSSSSPNVYTATNNFNAAVTFNSDVTFASPSANISFAQDATFTHDVYVTGTLHAGTITSVTESSSTVSAKTIITNVGGTTAGSIGSGLQVQGGDGTTETIVAQIITTSTSSASDTWSLQAVGKQAINFIGDSTRQMTFVSAGLSLNRTYTLPDVSGTIITSNNLPVFTLSGAVTGTGTGTITTSLASLQASAITWSGIQTISNTTGSSSISTGALVVAGGLGVTGTSYFGGLLWVPEVFSSTGFMAGNSITVGDFGGRFGGGFSSQDGQLIIYGSDGKGLEFAADTVNSQVFMYYNGANRILFKQTGVTNFISNIASTSTSTGTVIVTGGIGATGDIYASSFHGSGVGLTSIPVTALATTGVASSSTFLSGTGAWTSTSSSGAIFPVGMIVPFSGSSAPSGWLVCDGSAVSSTTYSGLFGVVGYTYGNPGSGNFNLPNLAGKVLVGAGGGYSLGSTGGATTASTTLSTANIPAHTHFVANLDDLDWAGSAGTNNLSVFPNSSLAYYVRPGGGNHTEAYELFGTSTTPTAGKTSSIGSGTAISTSTVQPYTTVNYIIKT